ncbi:MAG TPA: nicotinate-nucleotide adenylyltransferase [Candidatus Cybelea sp.]|nr:nicotinate-nucleotide adenylyltransferase [Candidatus Cybelea sp.]
MTSHPAPKSHSAHAHTSAHHGARHSVALFGGTFDPVHAGHLIVAHAAQRRFHLDAIYFIPSARPPHKSGSELTPFVHRYAMVTLACSEHRGFLPSLAEAPQDGATPQYFYTVDTVRRFRRLHPDDHIYFIVGADQFLEIPTWKNYESLLDLCDFIIASRPGFRIEALRLVVPPEKLARGPAHDPHKIVLRKSVIHLLTTVSSHISSTEVRERLEQKKNIHGLVPPRVEEYILGQALYR